MMDLVPKTLGTSRRGGRKSQRFLTRSKSLMCVTLTAWAVFATIVGTAEASWVDPDTPEEAFATRAYTKGDDRQYKLVFSDEFEQDGRTFHDGKDPRWTAVNKNDYTNAALHYYSDQNAVTSNGVLNITTERKVNAYKAFNEKTKEWYADKKYIQSGMLQGWNKFCFTGGIVEISAKLPGKPTDGGLWPALWMLGNLARATYVGSSDYVWPFSYSKCDPQNRLTQAVGACDRVNHYGMQPLVGRGSPEIDILESMQGDPGKLPSTNVQRPYQSCSLQVAPGLKRDRPVLGKVPKKGHWYKGLEYGNATKSELNPFFYGVTLVHYPKTRTYQSDAISANMQLNDTHYEDQHIYRIEWEPPVKNGTGGYIKWFTDEKLIFGIFGESLNELTQTEIPSEPMYLIMNTAVSSSWGFPPLPEGCSGDCFECGNPDCACALPTGYCDNFPASFEIDFVRVYQSEEEPKHILGCSPKDRPTELYIKGHADKYTAEGQKQPLQPVPHGGARCKADSDCGDKRNGYCSDKGFCVCQGDFTGPKCLAHNAFYDVDTRAKRPYFELSTMMVPRSLIVVAAILVAGFFISWTGAIWRKSKETKFKKLVNHNAFDHPSHGGTYGAVANYQNSDGADYVLPKQKVVTYCVIDGRLVDS